MAEQLEWSRVRRNLRINRAVVPFALLIVLSFLGVYFKADWLLGTVGFIIMGVFAVGILAIVWEYRTFIFKILRLVLAICFIGALTVLCYAAGWLSSPVAVLLFIIVLVLSYIALLMRRRLNNEERPPRFPKITDTSF